MAGSLSLAIWAALGNLEALISIVIELALIENVTPDPAINCL